MTTKPYQKPVISIVGMDTCDLMAASGGDKYSLPSGTPKIGDGTVHESDETIEIDAKGNEDW